MTPYNFINEFHRMCNSYGDDYSEGCEKCVLYKKGCLLNLHEMSPEDFNKIYRETATWAYEHSQKTNQSEFLKQFPTAQINQMDGLIDILPCHLYGEMLGTDLCSEMECEECRQKYWSAPVESEATE